MHYRGGLESHKWDAKAEGIEARTRAFEDQPWKRDIPPDDELCPYKITGQTRRSPKHAAWREGWEEANNLTKKTMGGGDDKALLKALEQLALDADYQRREASKRHYLERGRGPRAVTTSQPNAGEEEGPSPSL